MSMNNDLIIEIVLEKVKRDQLRRTLSDEKLAEYRGVLLDIAAGARSDQMGTYPLKYKYLRRFYDEVASSARD
jgi:hypothetical protein